MTESYIVNKADVLERRIDALEENMEHGFALVADTESKIGKCADLQMVAIIVTFIVAAVALAMAAFALRMGG